MYDLKKKTEPANDYSNLCSVEGCNKLWSVHISGQKPKCSFHQWEKSSVSYKRETFFVPKTPVPPSWWNEEKF